MPNKNKFYISTPVYYVNARPHIGHTYTTVAADVLARYHRLIGDNTFFAAGTDEHGAKIEQKAKAEGKEPKEFTDEISAQFQMAWDEMNISNDKFIRTTDRNHKKAVQNALQYMYDKGDIYLDKYEGYYCTGCEQFKNEKDLIDGKCPDHQTKPEWMSEETYVFKMSKYEKVLEEKIKKDELKIYPESRKNEILSFYKNEGLRDISFSRKNVKWGIELPWDKTHTAYVWSDAFLNYLTILSWDGKGGSPPSLGEVPERAEGAFWPPEMQLMSKDIMRVHATIWPAMLLSLDLPLQKAMFVHGFFLVDGQKMSKSIGNVIAPEELRKQYGVDATRYLLMSATTFGRDGDVGQTKFNEKYTADLANGIGNLVARSTTLVNKLRDLGSEIPDYCQRPTNLKGWSGQKWDEPIEIMWRKYQAFFKAYDLDKALGVIIKQVSKMDQYLAEKKPWKTIKDDPENTGIVLYDVIENLKHMAIMLIPFMPETAEEILKRIGIELKDLKDIESEQIFGLWNPKTKVIKGEPLFPRLEIKG